MKTAVIDDTNINMSIGDDPHIIDIDDTGLYKSDETDPRKNDIHMVDHGDPDSPCKCIC